MDQTMILRRVRELLDETHTGVLATADVDGRPHVRWMTPTLLPHVVGRLYCLTVPSSHKCEQLRINPAVSWSIQNRALTEIITLYGRAFLIDNPSLRSEIVETIGSRLFNFWKSHEKPHDFMVIETIVDEMIRYQPMVNQKEVVRVI